MGPWFKAGELMLQDGGLDYLGNPSLVHAQNVVATLLVEVLVMGAAEAFRAGGGPVPLGLGDDPDTLAELKVKEIKNGRLAMFACLGCFIQAIYTGEAPMANLAAHQANPWTVNGFAYFDKFSF